MGEPVCGSCPLDFIGDGWSCSKVNGCSSNPCHPGVNCISSNTTNNGFECGPCPLGYIGNGLKCNSLESYLDPCDPNPCHPGVSCVTIWEGNQTMFECGLCPDGMIGNGLNCTYTNPCWSNPCQPPKALCRPSIHKVNMFL